MCAGMQMRGTVINKVGEGGAFEWAAETREGGCSSLEGIVIKKDERREGEVPPHTHSTHCTWSLQKRVQGTKLLSCISKHTYSTNMYHAVGKPFKLHAH